MVLIESGSLEEDLKLGRYFFFLEMMIYERLIVIEYLLFGNCYSVYCKLDLINLSFFKDEGVLCYLGRNIIF